MIKHLIYTFFLFIFLCLLSSCTIFNSEEDSDLTEEEDYYTEGEQEEIDEEEVVVEQGEEIADEESIPEETADLDPTMDSEEEVEYIDAEDEEYLLEQGENIAVEEDDPIVEPAIDPTVDPTELEEPELAENDKSPDFFPADSSEPPSSPSSFFPPVKKNIPYKKVKTEPYQKAGFLINAVYIVRSGEDIKAVSQKLFGSDQVGQLYAINPHLKTRKVKVGDKIYYSSPNRPEDSSQLLFYFEDRGLQPTLHQVQAGENIRTVAKKLLGHSNSWKEIWATNPDLQSKGVLEDNLAIRYWPDGIGGGGGEAEVSPPTSEEETVPEDSPQLPEEQSVETSVDDDDLPLEEEPSSDEMALNDPSSVPPEPPNAEPPSDPTSAIMGEEEDKGPFLSRFSQTDMMAGSALALIALVCAFVIIKKRRKKKDFDYTAANFELDT